MDTGAAGARLGVRRLLGTAGFRRLLASRFAAQWGDGVFQAGLGGAVLFNPEREADPAAIAAGLAVLLLPYSVVGPFAGALLDRWDRRRVLVAANLLRGGLIAAVATLVAAGVSGPALYAGALLVTGASRFVLAGLSAALPRVVPPAQLVEANAVAATLGAAMTALGGGCAIALRGLVGADDAGSAWVTGSALLGSLLAAAVAVGFARGRLGPAPHEEPAETAVAVARGLREGTRAAFAAPRVAAGMAALGAHRLAFGISTVVTLLLYRYTFTDAGLLRAGLAGIGQLVTVAAAGVLAAAVLTPWLVARLGWWATLRSALGVAAVAQLGLGLPMTMWSLLAAAFVLAGAGQLVKLCLDAAVQHDVADGARGRVFALYDAMFNVGYVAAVAFAAALVPAHGRAPGLLVLAAGLYLLPLAGQLCWLRHRSKPGSPAR